MTPLKNLGYLLLVCCLLGTQASAAQNSPSVAYQLRAKDFDTSDSAQLLVTADAPANFGKIAVQFVAPPGFVVDPDTLNFDPQPGKRIIAINVRRAAMRAVANTQFSLMQVPNRPEAAHLWLWINWSPLHI